MSEIDPVELSRQLKKPSGELGHEVAQELNASNWELYDQAWGMIDFTSVQNILEIGFGNGKYLSRYFDFNPDVTVTGIDFSEEMCKEARGFHPDFIENEKLAIHCADSSSIPVGDQSQDIVVALNVIYFWDPPEPHLKEILRVLKSGGTLLLGYRPRHAVEHLDFTKQNFLLYEPEELEDLIAENGYEIDRHQQNSYSKKAPDGSDIQITDICLWAERSEH